MTESELKELGLTEEQYAEFFGSDEPANDAPVVQESPVAEVVATPEPEQPTEQPADVLTFKNVKAAATWMAGIAQIKLTCAVDSIYRALRENRKTHGVKVAKDAVTGLVTITKA